MHILRTIFLWRDTAYQRLGVRNYGDRTIDLRLSILFENDFADLFEVRGTAPRTPRHRDRKLRGNDQVLLIYHGLDGKLRRTTLTFDPPPDRLATDERPYDLRLAPGKRSRFSLPSAAIAAEARPLPFLRGLIAARRDLRAVDPRPDARSKLRTTASTRCSAGRPPISRC